MLVIPFVVTDFQALAPDMPVRLGALGVGAFLEAGAVAKRLRIEDKDKDVWYAEGRLGVYWD